MNESASKRPSIRLAAVLPYAPSHFRQTQIADGRVVHTYQESFLPWLVGEFLRLGAARIAIPADDPTVDYVAELPDRLKACITIVDQDKEILKRVEALMEPIVDEVPVQFRWGGYFPTSKNPADPAVQSVINIRKALHKILLGLKCRLQVDLDLDDTRKSCLMLRDTLKSGDALLRTNRLLGLLDSYKLEKVGSLEFVSDLEEDRVREFESLLDDELFRQLSEQGYFLGVPGKLKRAIWEIKEVAAKIVRGRAKSLLRVAATPVNVATGKLLDVSAIADFLPESKPVFLPPIAWFSAAHKEARARFAANETPSEPVSGEFVLMPQTFTNIESFINLAREELGARLKDNVEDRDRSTKLEDDK